MTIGIALGVKCLGGEGVVMRALSRFSPYLYPAYLREFVLLLRREIDISEEQCVMLLDSGMSGTIQMKSKKQ